jgi:hypothetical protein
MKKITLTQNKIALVDDCDFKDLNQHSWQGKTFSNGKTYALRNIYCAGKFITVLMHREILGIKKEKGVLVDHRNGDTLDNQRHNLRAATASQNTMNKRKRMNCSSRFKGVYFAKWTGKWRASIQKEGKRIQLGLFRDELEAALAYDQKAKELFGEFALLNVVSQGEPHAVCH